jgi:nucleotide-binding universal stress UspA family protein
MKRILVALDSSPRAAGVLAAASRLAEMADAKLVVFRAIGVPPDMPREIFNMTDVRLEDYLQANARSALERLVAELPAGRVERISTAFAIAWDGICTAARENDADLIVIGAHGYGRLDRVLGTTAGKVVNHADRNVLVVRSVL